MSGLAVKIKNVRIQNFKSIEDLSIRLNDGLNILIGDNGAGKSNFLDGVDRIISDVFSIANGPNKPSTIHSRVLTYEIDFEYRRRGDIYLFQLRSAIQKLKKEKDNFENVRVITYSKYKNGKSEAKNVQVIWHEDSLETSNLHALQKEIERIDLGAYGAEFIEFTVPSRIDYITSPGKLIVNSETRSVNEPESEGAISSLMVLFDMEVEGNLENLRTSTLQPEQIRKELLNVFDAAKSNNKYSSLLKKYTPIKDIQLNENINIYKAANNIIVDNIVVNFKVNGDWIPWSFLSDGTKRLFHIITEVVLGESNIILIEEPELGVHPDQLYLLMDFFKSQAVKKQILISSHSPISLDILGPGELDNIIITKLTSRGTKMYHLNELQLSKANAYIKKVGKLSDYWLHSDLEK
jgi:predicted ATP-dependent endonuclease of OLD family